MRITYRRTVLPVPFRPSALAAWRWVALREMNRATRSCASGLIGAACSDNYPLAGRVWCSAYGAPTPPYLPGYGDWVDLCTTHHRSVSARCA